MGRRKREPEKTSLTKLGLSGFKNFDEAKIDLGPFTVLVGTNASGKSNVRDAFRFLHGISRSYVLAEIIGERWEEGGILQWRGIRGGTREATYLGRSSYMLKVEFEIETATSRKYNGAYSIEVQPDNGSMGPRVLRESLYRGSDMMFDSHPSRNAPDQSDPQQVTVRIQPGGAYRRGHTLSFVSNKPVLTQIAERVSKLRSDERARKLTATIGHTISALRSMRFLDLSPEAMRMPSFPGQTVLGDRGENLSSVLQAICDDQERKRSLIQWVRELTPMDATDFVFPSDHTGKILATLIEADGRRTSAQSASDGTLRFLAMICALLGPNPARFYFFEELENGIHPTRLHLLLQLIEQKVMKGSIQMVATSHSPQLLGLLSFDSLKHASLTYRLEGKADGRIRRIMDIPEAADIIEKQDLARLHSSGGLEDVVSFLDDDDSQEEAG